MATNVIDARAAFVKRNSAPLTHNDQLAMASSIITNATEMCKCLGILPDAVTTILAMQILQIADVNCWTEEKRQKILPPALHRLLDGQGGAPY